MNYRWMIAWFWFDPAIGSEQAGNRPALVVSGEVFNQSMSVLTVLPITTRREGRRVYPNEVLLAAGTGGLPDDSIILAHQIRTVSRGRLKRTVGYISDRETQRAVHDAISHHLELYWD